LCFAFTGEEPLLWHQLCHAAGWTFLANATFGGSVYLLCNWIIIRSEREGDFDVKVVIGMLSYRYFDDVIVISRANEDLDVFSPLIIPLL
jgi:hypothetical protein